MNTIVRSVVRLITRLLAATVVVALLVGPVLVIARIAGNPVGSGMWSRLTERRIDDATIIRLGSIAFYVLWAWFAMPALRQLQLCLTHRPSRSGRSTPEPATGRGPRAWLAQLVRHALTTTTIAAVVTTSSTFVFAATASSLETAQAAAPVAAAQVLDSSVAPIRQHDSVSEVIARRRDTPYSIAARLFPSRLDAARDEILSLNLGRPTPEGDAYHGGGFPIGMTVLTPYVSEKDSGGLSAEANLTTGSAGAEHSPVPVVAHVVKGDNLWDLTQAHYGRVDPNIVAMVAAHNGITNPSLIVPGQVVNFPDMPSTALAAAVAPPNVPVVQQGSATWAVHEVVKGETLWDIIDAHYGHVDGDMVWQVADANRLQDPSSIAIGTLITLPAVGSAPVDLPMPSVELPPPVEITESAPPVPPTVVVELPPPVQEPAVAAPTLDPPASLPAPELPVPIDAPATPVVAAAAPDVTVVEQAPDEGIPVKEGLAAAALLSAGAIAVLQARRRQQLRSAQVGARLLQPTDEAVETETLLRSLSVVDRLARVDLALRCAAPELAAQLARVIAVEISEAGEVRLYPDRPATVISPHWIADAESDDGAWRLPADVSLADLADDARRAHQPCPALIHIGESAGGQLFVDLEAVGVLGVQASPETSAAIVRCAAASLAVSPFAESSRIFTFGLEDETQLGSLNVEAHASLGDAIEAVRTTVGSIIPATSGSVTTFALRAAAHGGEAWEPSLLLALGGNAGADDVTGLVALAGGGGRGVGAMIDRPVGNGGMTLRADGNDFVLEPLGRRVTPVGLSAADVAAVDNLLDAADRPLVSDVDESAEAAATPVSVTEFADPAHELVVSVLGQVGVQSTGGEPVGFERSKAQELVVWLSQHRHRPTRAAARTAMWDLAVRDATFSNVVSDARRAMAKVVAPPAGQEWIGRTMSEDLPLHELVVSDAELLAHRVTAARGLDATAAIAVLRPGVERINGMPFAGTAYLWPDAEGTTSSLVLLATSAAAELAAHHLAVDDVDGVFWATGQGLKVLAGHEELIALRMRAHAHRGDLAGVRSEWESYERALNADTWAAAEPSPKLVELRKELLSPSLAS